MALGTVTIVRTGDVEGNTRVVVADIQPTSGANYTAGGSVITAASLGLDAVQRAFAQVVTQGANGPGSAVALPQADGSLKLKSNVPAGTGETGAGVDLSAGLVRVTAFGY